MESQDNFAYLLPFIMATFGTVFLVVERWGAVSARYWGFGYISAALGFSSPLIVAALPIPAQALISNVFFFAAFFFYGQALLVRFSRPTLVPARLLICAAAIALVAYEILVEQDLRGELTVGDFTCIALLALPLWSVRGHVIREADKVLVAMVCLVVAETLIRVTSLLVMTTAGSYPSMEGFLSSDYAFYMQFAASIVGFLLALTVLGTLVLDVIGRHRDAAERDPLTDLLNRRGFEQALPDFARGAFPDGAVLVGDIDHFKQVNDLFGHAAGDYVIIGFAQTLRRHLPKDAAVARFGGEEFVAFLPDVSLAEAGRLGDAIRLAFAEHGWHERGIDQQITASFGVSATARGDHSVHDAIGRADACLYAAKAGGRNQVVVEGRRSPEISPALRVVSST